MASASALPPCEVLLGITPKGLEALGREAFGGPRQVVVPTRRAGGRRNRLWDGGGARGGDEVKDRGGEHEDTIIVSTQRAETHTAP